MRPIEHPSPIPVPAALAPAADSVPGPPEGGIGASWRKPGPLHRLARRLFWPRPAIHRLVAIGRGRPLSLPRAGQFWVGGYPRSANTYTAYALQRCIRPGESVAFHLHIPPQILRLHRAGENGILVIREPLSAAISWCQYFQLRKRGVDLIEALAWALDYYIDFHRVLQPAAPAMFIAEFADCTRDIRAVLQRFFIAAGKTNNVPEMDGDELKSGLERHWTNPTGAVDEMAVGRPSAVRSELRASHWRRPELLGDERVKERLDEAEALYRYFLELSLKPKAASRPGA